MNKQDIFLSTNGEYLSEDGYGVSIPSAWEFLPAGDAGLTRKITSKGYYWRLKEKKGRRIISKGLWAPKNIIQQAKIDVDTQRQSTTYIKRKEYSLKYRAKQQEKYEEEFNLEIISFLNFHDKYKLIALQIAHKVCVHAVAVGSGTVARTKMIPIQQRAEKAVIAWMRHKTTPYDNIKIARIKGERRKIRRNYAQISISLLNNYRKGSTIDKNCPLLLEIKQNEANISLEENYK